MRTNEALLCLLILVLGTIVGCWDSDSANLVSGKTKGEESESKSGTRAVEQIVKSEELILHLSTELNKLKHSVLNLELPEPQALPLFANSVETNMLAASEIKVSTSLIEQPISLEFDPLENYPPDSLNLWKMLLNRLRYFENPKFYIIKGEFKTEDCFETSVGFQGLAVPDTGNFWAIRARIKVSWVRGSSESQPAWRISSWINESLTVNESKRVLFEEVVDDVLQNSLDKQKVKRARHGEYLSTMFREGRVQMDRRDFAKYFLNALDGQHPGLSVVDLNDDGIDELYICDEWMKNQLLVRGSDGQFVEMAKEFGLDIDGTCSSAVFADLDNDGDKDAIIGRNLSRSVILLNENGKFIEQKSLGAELPYLVTSISCADVNNDGLLDIFFCTYGFPGGKISSDHICDTFLSTAEAKQFKEAETKKVKYIHETGPPNCVLYNQGGGKFKRVNQPAFDQCYNTFQASWADFDDDGDQDLYVSNDFAPDFLFRNDDGQLTDITTDSGNKAMQGFGMGASWGDYDLDGKSRSIRFKHVQQGGTSDYQPTT